MNNANDKKYIKISASLDIDSQQCFTPLCPYELPVIDGDIIADELNKQASYCNFRIGTKDAHSPLALWITRDHENIATAIPNNTSRNIDLYWPEHAIPGTKGFELIPGLPHPCEYDYFVWKGIELDMHPYGACYHDLNNKMSTGLIEYLKYNRVEYTIIGGLALDYCVKNSALQLKAAGFKVIVNLAATKGISVNTIEQAKIEMHNQGIIFIDNSTKIPSLLKIK